MIAASSGHGTACRATCGSIAPTASAYAPLATVVGVASRPMRPVRVAATAWKASRRTTPTTSTPSARMLECSCSRGSAAPRAIIPERSGRGNLRALVVSNMLADDAHPERGSFVRDQVTALRGVEGIDVELFEFAPGAAALARAGAQLRRRRGSVRFD